jgi:hypothetical protein
VTTRKARTGGPPTPDLADVEAKLQRLGFTPAEFSKAAAFAVIGAKSLRARFAGPDVEAATAAIEHLADDVAIQAQDILRRHEIDAAVVRQHIAGAVAYLRAAAHEVKGSRLLGAARRVGKIPSALRAYSLPEFVTKLAAAAKAARPRIRLVRREIAVLLVAHGPKAEGWPSALRPEREWVGLSRPERAAAVAAALKLIESRARDIRDQGGDDARRRRLFGPLIGGAKPS